jgi:hypothetical protein
MCVIGNLPLNGHKYPAHNAHKLWYLSLLSLVFHVSPASFQSLTPLIDVWTCQIKMGQSKKCWNSESVAWHQPAYYWLPHAQPSFMYLAYLSIWSDYPYFTANIGTECAGNLFLPIWGWFMHNKREANSSGEAFITSRYYLIQWLLLNCTVTRSGCSNRCQDTAVTLSSSHYTGEIVGPLGDHRGEVFGKCKAVQGPYLT